MNKITLLFFVLFFASCTANHVEINECVYTSPDGFLKGVWHGFISPITFFISLFSDTIDMYSINNTGGGYDFGFVLGAGILLGSGTTKVKIKK